MIPQGKRRKKILNRNRNWASDPQQVTQMTRSLRAGSSHPQAYASGMQVTMMENLMTEHDLYLGHWDRAWKILEAHRIDERTPGDGARLTEAQANRMLRWMVRQIDRKSDYYWAGKMKVQREVTA